MTPADLRDLLNDESLVLRLTSSAPPLSQNIAERSVKGRVVYELWQEEEPADRNGQNLSGQMVSLIGGIGPDLASYSPRWPVRRALAEWERSCRRRHRPGPSLQWRDHAAGPLCSDLLRAASIGVSLRWCCDQWGIEYPRGERLLLAGLRFIAERLVRWQDDQLGLVHDADRCPTCIDEARSMRGNTAPA